MIPFTATPSPARLPVAPQIDGAAGVDHRWLWSHGGLVPVAVLVDHGDHYMQVTWAAYAGGPSPLAALTLDSLRPLTVVEEVRCSTCGALGRINAGAWVPSEGEGS